MLSCRCSRWTSVLLAIAVGPVLRGKADSRDDWRGDLKEAVTDYASEESKLAKLLALESVDRNGVDRLLEILEKSLRKVETLLEASYRGEVLRKEIEDGAEIPVLRERLLHALEYMQRYPKSRHSGLYGVFRDALGSVRGELTRKALSGRFLRDLMRETGDGPAVRETLLYFVRSLHPRADVSPEAAGREVAEAMEAFVAGLEKFPVREFRFAGTNRRIYAESLRFFGELNEEERLALVKMELPPFWDDPDTHRMARVLATDMIARLLEKVGGKESAFAEAADVVLRLVKQERHWIEKSSPRKQKPGRKIDSRLLRRYLEKPLEYPSIYPLLDLVDGLPSADYLKREPAEKRLAVVRPFLSELVMLLRLAEPAVEKSRLTGEVAIRRLWHRVRETLVRWAGSQQRLWSHEWAQAIAAEDFSLVPSREERKVARRSRTVAVTPATFFGTALRSSRVVLVLDLSESMGATEDQPGRISVLKDESARFLEQLPKGAHYNLIGFSTDSRIEDSLTRKHRLQNKVEPAGKLAKRTRRWIEDLQAIEQGKTVMRRPFEVAFGTRSRGDWRLPFDEIIFITDGVPTDRDGMELPTVQLDALRDFVLGNARLHSVTIHTFGFPEAPDDLLQELATRTGGKMAEI